MLAGAMCPPCCICVPTPCLPGQRSGCCLPTGRRADWRSCVRACAHAHASAPCKRALRVSARGCVCAQARVFARTRVCVVTHARRTRAAQQPQLASHVTDILQDTSALRAVTCYGGSYEVTAMLQVTSRVTAGYCVLWMLHACNFSVTSACNLNPFFTRLSVLHHTFLDVTMLHVEPVTRPNVWA